MSYRHMTALVHTYMSSPWKHSACNKVLNTVPSSALTISFTESFQNLDPSGRQKSEHAYEILLCGISWVWNTCLRWGSPFPRCDPWVWKWRNGAAWPPAFIAFYVPRVDAVRRATASSCRLTFPSCRTLPLNQYKTLVAEVSFARRLSCSNGKVTRNEWQHRKCILLLCALTIHLKLLVYLFI